MIFSLSQIIALLLQYKYLVLFPVAIVEGPIVTVLAGFLASQNYLNIFVSFGLIVVADLIGDSMFYAIGRWGGQTFIQRWGRYIGLHPERVAQVEAHFTKHSGKTLLVGKLSHFVGFAFLAAAGLARMPFSRFIWFNLLGTIPKSLLLILIGFYFGQSYAEFNKYLSYTTLIFIGISAFLIILYVVMIKFIKKWL